MKHTRQQILAKRAAAHAAIDRLPVMDSPIISNGIYCHLFLGGREREPQIISNCTGRPIK